MPEVRDLDTRAVKLESRGAIPRIRLAIQSPPSSRSHLLRYILLIGTFEYVDYDGHKVNSNIGRLVSDYRHATG